MMMTTRSSSPTFTLANNISEKRLAKGFSKSTNLESKDSNHSFLMIHQKTMRAWVCDTFNNEIEYAFDAQSVVEWKRGLDGAWMKEEEEVSLLDFMYGDIEHTRPDVSDELDEGIFWDAKTGMIKMHYGLKDDRVFEVRGPMVYVSPSLSAREISGSKPRA